MSNIDDSVNFSFPRQDLPKRTPIMRRFGAFFDIEQTVELPEIFQPHAAHATYCNGKTHRIVFDR